jgi:hypothetical protein
VFRLAVLLVARLSQTLPIHLVHWHYPSPLRMSLAPFSDGAHLHFCTDCDRPFAGPGPLNFHRRSCKKTKRRLQGLLEKAKELWEARKRSKRHPLSQPQAAGCIRDPPTQTAPLTTAISTTATLGSTATLGTVVAEGRLLPPASVRTQAILAQSDTVCCSKGPRQITESILTDYGLCTVGRCP